MADMCSYPPHGGVLLAPMHTCLVPLSGSSMAGDMQLFYSFKREVPENRLGEEVVVISALPVSAKT